MENNKEKLLNDLREHVLFVRSKISQKTCRDDTDGNPQASAV